MAGTIIFYLSTFESKAHFPVRTSLEVVTWKITFDKRRCHPLLLLRIWMKLTNSEVAEKKSISKKVLKLRHLLLRVRAAHAYTINMTYLLVTVYVCVYYRRLL